MIWHQLKALAQVPGLIEVVLIGVYDDAVLQGFLKESKREFPNLAIK
jgi:mannose-1-phosphate guanylyltransferase